MLTKGIFCFLNQNLTNIILSLISHLVSTMLQSLMLIPTSKCLLSQIDPSSDPAQAGTTCTGLPPCFEFINDVWKHLDVLFVSAG
jgi:hypothetical protein